MSGQNFSLFQILIHHYVHQHLRESQKEFINLQDEKLATLLTIRVILLNSPA